MPRYKIKDPDGIEWEIDGPEGASREEVVRAVIESKAYSNAKYVKSRLKGEDQGITGTLPEKAPDNASQWFRNIPYPKEQPSYSDVWEASKVNVRNALRRTAQEAKDSNLSPEEKAANRQRHEQDMEKGPDVNYEDLSILRKIVSMGPPALTVGGAALGGTLFGGPVGGALAGGGTLAAIAGGAARGERAGLESQGISPEVAKQIEGVSTLSPLVQGASMLGGPITGMVGTPLTGELSTQLKNRLLQDQIHGPRTSNFPIEPYKYGAADTAIDAALGGLGGLGSRSMVGPRPPKALPPPPQLPGNPPPRLGGPAAPPPTRPPGPSGGPAAPPPTRPPGPSGGPSGGVPGGTPPKGGAPGGAPVKDILRTRVVEKHTPKLDAFFDATGVLKEVPVISKTSSGVKVTVKTPTKPPTTGGKVASGVLPETAAAAGLPPASPNPFAPPVTQDGQLYTDLDMEDPANDYEMTTDSLLKEVAEYNRRYPEDAIGVLEVIEGGKGKETPDGPPEYGPGYEESLGTATPKIRMPDSEYQEYLDSMGSKQRPPPSADYEQQYLDSLGSPTRPSTGPTAAPQTGEATPVAPTPAQTILEAPVEAPKGVLNASSLTPTTPEVRQAIADRLPIQTLPGNLRVQEGPGTSRQQVADQQALAKKLTYAGYQEQGKTGKWVYKGHKDPDFEKKVKKLPETGVDTDSYAALREFARSIRDKYSKEIDDVDKGDAVPENFWKFDDDIEGMDRVWGQSPSGPYLPWVKNDSLTPYRINPRRTFIVYNRHLKNYLEEYGGGELNPETPEGIRKLFSFLIRYVPWLSDPRLLVRGGPKTAAEFQTLLGPVFLENGYDAITVRSQPDQTPYMIPFDPSLVEQLSPYTARSVTAEKNLEHVSQLKKALWFKTDRDFRHTSQGLNALEDAITAGKSLPEALDVAIEFGPSEGVRQLAAALKRAAQAQMDAGIITSMYIEEGTPEDPAGYYNFSEGDGKITLYVKNNGVSFRTFLHEVIHSITIPITSLLARYSKDPNADTASPIYKKYVELRDRTAEFYGFVQRNLPALQFLEDGEVYNEQVKKLLYNKSPWTENVHEVLAYALTDPVFQELLHNIPVKEGNGLWNISENVRNFHDIPEDMNTLLYETVKLFDEYANFAQHLSLFPNLADYGIGLKNAVYYARPEIRGPPDIDKGIGFYLKLYNEAQVMHNGQLPKEFTVDHQKLVGALSKASIKPTLVPLFHGAQIYQALGQGTIPTTPFQEAPAYLAVYDFLPYKGDPAGVQLNNKVLFVVNNVRNSAFQGALERVFPGAIFSMDDFLFLLRKGVPIQTPVKSWVEEDEIRQRLELLPKAVESALPKATMDKLKNIEQWTDPDTVEEAIATFKANPKDLTTTIFNQFVSGAETFGSSSENPLIRFFRGKVNLATASQSQVSRHIITPMGEAYGRMSKRERVRMATFLIYADREELEFNEKDVRARGFSDDAVQYWKYTRAALDYGYAQWNEKRTRLGLPPVPYRKGYLPSIFEGDYRMIVKLPGVDEDGKPVEEIVGMMGAFGKLSFNKYKKAILDKYPNAIITALPKKSLDGAPMPGSLLELYVELTKQLGPHDPNIQNIQDMLAEFAKFDEAKYLGFHVHERAKKGIWGAEGDKFWLPDEQNADDLHSALVRYIEEGDAHHNTLELMQDMDKIFLDPELNQKAPNTLMYLKEAYNHVLRHNPRVDSKYSPLARAFKKIGGASDKLLDVALMATDVTPVGVGPTALQKASGAVRYAFATWAMGLGNLTFMGLQLAQIPLFAPQMDMLTRKELGLSFSAIGRTAAFEAALEVTRYIATTSPTSKKTRVAKMVDAVLGKPNTEMKMAIKYAEDFNLINFTEIERALEKTLNPKAATVDRVLNFNQRYAEVMTRPLAFLWFYKLLRKGGLPQKEALEAARHKTQFVMVPYDLRDRPMVYASLGAYGVALGQLKTFMHSSIHQSGYWSKITVTKKTFAPFIYGTSAALLVQGQMGMIPMQDIDNLVRAMNGKNIGIKEFIAEHMPLAVERGLLSEWTNVDFYSRLRSPPVIQDSLPSMVLAPSLGWAKQQTDNVYGIVKSTIDFGFENAPKSAAFQRGVLGSMPPPGKGWTEYGFRGPNDEAPYYTKSNPLPLTGYKRNEFDWTLRKWGLRSVDESLAMEQYRDKTTDKFIGRRDKMEVIKEVRQVVQAPNLYSGEALNKKIEGLQKEFLASGGSLKEWVRLMKNNWRPETMEQHYYGKPSQQAADRFMDLYRKEEARSRDK